MSLKIVHVLSPLAKGGGERVAVDLANFHAAQGHQVAIVPSFPVDPSLLERRIHRTVEVRFVHDSPTRRQPYVRILPWLARHSSWLQERDIVHCHMTFGTVLGCAIRSLRRLSRRATPAVVETCHSVGMAISSFNRFAQMRLASQMDAVALMAHEPAWDAFVAAHPHIPIASIPNGIADDVRRPTSEERKAYREANGIPLDASVVGTVTRLVHERRPDRYISLFRLIADGYGENVHFVIAGEGPELESLRAMANEYGLTERLHFTGFVSEPAVPFSVFDLYVTVNVGANAGVAALEAAMFGLPIIAIQLDESYDEGRDPTDWTGSSFHVDRLAPVALELLANAELRNTRADRQAAYVRSKHGVAVMARGYDKLYEAAILQCRASR